MPLWPGLFYFGTFWVMLRAILGLYQPQGLLRVFVILFSYHLSIQPFCYVLSVSIFYSKIVLLPLHPVVGFYSCILHLLVGIVFYCYFGMSCFVCIIWSYLGIFWVSLLSSIPFDLFLPVVFVSVVYCFVLLFSFQHITMCFSFLSIFACFAVFFTYSSEPNFPSHFCSAFRAKFCHPISVRLP